MGARMDRAVRTGRVGVAAALRPRAVVGTRVGDVAWPPDTALVAILRGGQVIAPTPDDPLETGDELLFVSAPDQERAIQELLSA